VSSFHEAISAIGTLSGRVHIIFIGKSSSAPTTNDNCKMRLPRFYLA
jgi:hypothetical protein